MAAKDVGEDYLENVDRGGQYPNRIAQPRRKWRRFG
jgi:hypothetical protein